MCGIAGIVSTSEVNQDLYEALTVLQHRGQEAVGITSFDKGLYLGIMCDPEIVSDVDKIAAYAAAEFRALREAAGVAESDLPADEHGETVALKILQGDTGVRQQQEEFGALIRRELARWGEVVKAAGVKVD